VRCLRQPREVRDRAPQGGVISAGGFKRCRDAEHDRIAAARSDDLKAEGHSRFVFAERKAEPAPLIEWSDESAASLEAA
jgi:hypothetical protein